MIIDLGDVKNITRIEIQGRPHSTEYVTEFSISYGYNGLDYQDFKEPGGNTKVCHVHQPTWMEREINHEQRKFAPLLCFFPIRLTKAITVAVDGV